MVNLLLSGRSWVGWFAGGIINLFMYVLLFLCLFDKLFFLQMHLLNYIIILFIYNHLFIFVDDWGGAGWLGGTFATEWQIRGRWVRGRFRLPLRCKTPPSGFLKKPRRCINDNPRLA